MLRSQWAQGNQNVQISDVSDGSTIHITYEAGHYQVPLDPAVVPVGRNVNSPARLIRARSGVIPFAARVGLLSELKDWATGHDAFALCLIGGGAGSGKTRLGVQLCVEAGESDWLCGLLSRRADAAAMDALAHAPTARLVVVDYAETRAEQLEVMLPLLKAKATGEQPVRVLLIVRTHPLRTDDWAESLRHHADSLDALLDNMDVHSLEDVPLVLAERQSLFSVAAAAFAARTVSAPKVVPVPPPRLDQALFASPLLVVIAAYLAVHDDEAVPTTQAELLKGLEAHEDRYWRASMGELQIGRALRRRVAALATLAAADSEEEAAELLCLIPDLADANAERTRSLARWAHDLYPGAGWWNPLEPDLLGEHLVADCYSEYPRVLGGVLDRSHPQDVFQPLDLYARAASDRPSFAAVLRPVLTERLGALCTAAVTQAATETDPRLMLGNATVSSALDRAVRVIGVEPGSLPGALNQFPARDDLVLNPLALTLAALIMAHRRRLAASDPAADESELAASLNNLSVYQGAMGRRHESLANGKEAVRLYRQLAGAEPEIHNANLASALVSLSVHFGSLRLDFESLAAVDEAVGMYRRLVVAMPAIHYSDLASALNYLTVRLGAVGQLEASLAASKEAVGMYRRLAVLNSDAYTPDLASSLNNWSVRLGAAGELEQALAKGKEAVAIYRRLSVTNPAAWESGLSFALNNLSGCLCAVGLLEESLASSRQVVEIRRRLVIVNPSVHEPNLALALKTLSTCLDQVGRHTEGLAASKEAIAIYLRLAEVYPAVYHRYLTPSMTSSQRP